MNEVHYRIIGWALTLIGIAILLSPIFFIVIAPQLLLILVDTVFISIGFYFLGLTVTCSGMIILRRFRKVQLFLTKGGEPIHSAEVWKKGTESGMYLTSCGRVVSINQSSEGTAHVGYKLATAQRTTCRDCSLREGRAIIRSASRKEY